MLPVARGANGQPPSPPIEASSSVAPRATGNIATEDLVYLLDGLGVDHGCDLDELIRVSTWLEGVLGHELPGLLHRAGRFPA